MTENKLFRRNIKAEAGRSMVEMLGVLAIIGVLSVGGISGYSKAMAKYKASKAMDQLSLLIANIRTAFATVSHYGDLNNGTAAQYSIVSRDMYVNGSATMNSQFGLVNAFGGKMFLGAYTYNGIPNAGFAIVYNGLNTEACVQLATADWGTGGLAFISINSAQVDTIPTTQPTANGTTIFDVGDMPIALNLAYTACGGTNDNNKSITWYFY